MKCPTCGYVSFDDLEACKKCGTAFNSSGEEQADGAQRSRLQEELFSLRLNDDTLPSPPSGEEPEVPGGEEKQELLEGPAEPKLEVGPEAELVLEPEPEGEFRLNGLDEPVMDEPVMNEPVMDEPVMNEPVMNEGHE
jgi:hypothetical protein